jgi:hypothetical protein
MLDQGVEEYGLPGPDVRPDADRELGVALEALV